MSTAVTFFSHLLLYPCATCNNLSLYAKMPLLKLPRIVGTLSTDLHCNNQLGTIFHAPFSLPPFFAFLSYLHNRMQK